MHHKEWTTICDSKEQKRFHFPIQPFTWCILVYRPTAFVPSCIYQCWTWGHLAHLDVMCGGPVRNVFCSGFGQLRLERVAQLHLLHRPWWQCCWDSSLARTKVVYIQILYIHTNTTDNSTDKTRSPDLCKRPTFIHLLAFPLASYFSLNLIYIKLPHYKHFN